MTIEEASLQGGFGSAVLEHCSRHAPEGAQVRTLGVEDRFVEHGKREQLLELVGLTPSAVRAAVLEAVSEDSGIVG